jgi:hypothetical protein
MEEPGVHVRSREGELVPWSRKAARCAGTINNLIEDAPNENDEYRAEVIAKKTLGMLAAMCEPDYVPSLAEVRVEELFCLIEGAFFLDATTALENLQRELAARLAGKSPEALCEVLNAAVDLPEGGRDAALAEPSFMPAGYGQEPAAKASGAPALQPQPSMSGVPVNEDAKEVALGTVDVQTLCNLKGVNRTWGSIARCVLCSRLCQREGQAYPARLADITDLNVECLSGAGRVWDAATAGRQLTNLARLHGFGFEVDIAAVRAVDLHDEDDDGDDDGRVIALAEQLHDCFTGEGEPPLELLLATVACAASGEVWGIPVRELREGDVAGDLDLSKRRFGPSGAQLLCLLLPGMASVLTLKYVTSRTYL